MTWASVIPNSWPVRYIWPSWNHTASIGNRSATMIRSRSITTIPSLKSRSVQFHQQLFLSATGKLATEARLTTVSINFAGKSIPLPPELRQKLETFLK